MNQSPQPYARTPITREELTRWVQMLEAARRESSAIGFIPDPSPLERLIAALRAADTALTHFERCGYGKHPWIAAWRALVPEPLEET